MSARVPSHSGSAWVSRSDVSLAQLRPAGGAPAAQRGGHRRDGAEGGPTHPRPPTGPRRPASARSARGRRRRAGAARPTVRPSSRPPVAAIVPAARQGVGALERDGQLVEREARLGARERAGGSPRSCRAAARPPPARSERAARTMVARLAARSASGSNSDGAATRASSSTAAGREQRLPVELAAQRDAGGVAALRSRRPSPVSPRGRRGRAHRLDPARQALGERVAPFVRPEHDGIGTRRSLEEVEQRVDRGVGLGGHEHVLAASQRVEGHGGDGVRLAGARGTGHDGDGPVGALPHRLSLGRREEVRRLAGRRPAP